MTELATARCRFCRRVLRSAGSRAAGYGPRCARDRGLPPPSRMPVTAATRASGGPAGPARPTGPPGPPQAVTRAYKPGGQLPLWHTPVPRRLTGRPITTITPTGGHL